MPVGRSGCSVCSMGLTPLRQQWVRIGAQVLILEVVVVLGTLFAARFHPHSRPVDTIALGLGVLAAGAIGLSWRWPAAAVGIALASVLVSHWLGYAPAAIDLALMVALFKAATPQRPWRAIALGAAVVLGYAAVGSLTGGISPEGLLLGTLAVPGSCWGGVAGGRQPDLGKGQGGGGDA